MARLDNNDLAQMSRDYFQSLEKDKLVEVADNLHRLAVEQWERINSNSSNSSQPPSGDNPYQKPEEGKVAKKDLESTPSSKKKTIPQLPNSSKSKRKPGRQKGSKGFGRSKPLSISSIIAHYPIQCSACNQALVKTESKPYMGHHVLELEKTELGLQIVCQLHHYYQSNCSCGHQSKSQPGVGITSLIAESINSRTARIGTLILEDLRDFIRGISEGKTKPELEKIIRSLQGVCHLGKKVKHNKLKALASEILNDWDAVVAAVNNPDLPLTNNEAERALRHAVIARRISYGTRTTEGSIAYSSLLSVIETCRLRQVNPWEYISSVISEARKGLSPPLLSSGVVT